MAPTPPPTDAPACSGELARTWVAGDGVSIAYRLTRSAADPPPGGRRAVVLVHGMASNLTRWSEFVATTKLGQQWDVLRIDLRGHGDSLTRGRVDMGTWCNDLAEILAREGITRVVLVGHCLGANLSLQFAGLKPELVLGLVLIEPMLPRALAGALGWAVRLRPLLRAALPLLLGLAALGLHRRRLLRLDLQALDAAARQTQARTGHFPEARFASTWEDLKSFPFVIYVQDLIAVTGPWPELSGIAAPTLVLLASGSGLGALEPTRQALAALPRGRIRLVDAQHWIPTEQPEALRLAVEQCCASLAQTAGAAPA